MLYERKLMKMVRKWIDKKTIVVITGMRQVGKTTMLRMLFDEIKSSNKVFIDMENPINQKVFEDENYDNVLENLRTFNINQSNRAYIFLDEIQAMPDAIKVVKYLFDHYDIQFFVTGSSSFYLKNLFSESLAGRKVIFELYPLDFEEFLIFRHVIKKFYTTFEEKNKHKNYIEYQHMIRMFDEFIEYGGFPRVVLATTNEEKKAFLEDIFKSYFEKDVRSFADFENIGKLRDFIILLMQRTGSKLNINKISSALNVSRPTLYKYLSFLEATYFISLIKPFSKSVDSEISRAKKVYICDTGILNHFSRVAFGSILENAVFNLLKTKYSVDYYQKDSGAEIDFIIKEQGIALEIKEHGTIHDLQKLKKLANEIDMKKQYIISKNFNNEDGFIPVTEL